MKTKEVLANNGGKWGDADPFSAVSFCSAPPTTCKKRKTNLSVKVQGRRAANPQPWLSGPVCAISAECWRARGALHYLSARTDLEHAHSGGGAMPRSLQESTCPHCLVSLVCIIWTLILPITAGIINHPIELHGKKLFNQKFRSIYESLNSCSRGKFSVKFYRIYNSNATHTLWASTEFLKHNLTASLPTQLHFSF